MRLEVHIEEGSTPAHSMSIDNIDWAKLLVWEEILGQGDSVEQQAH